MDTQGKLIKNFFAIFSYPVSYTSKFLVYTNLFGIKKDFEKIMSFYNSLLRINLPSVLINALIVGEDHRFFLHKGFDPIAVIRALWNLVLKDNRQGGSTIEQQLVRVVTGNYQPTIKRKLREILLASIIDEIIPKDEIPSVYLYTAYFGWRMNGVFQAFKRLNFSENCLTELQAAKVIARLKFPEPQYASKLQNQRVKNRTQHIYEKIKYDYTAKSLQQTIGITKTYS
jgi:penicillin-binding protein 1A